MTDRRDLASFARAVEALEPYLTTSKNGKPTSAVASMARSARVKAPGRPRSQSCES